jgi:anthranilate synthase component 1
VKITEIDDFDLSLLCKLNTDRYPFLLESVIENNENRYSMLFAYPQKTLQCKDISFLDELQKEIFKTKTTKATKTTNKDIPFLGGYFCYFSYEFAGILEPHTNVKATDKNIANATYVPVAIIKDHHKKITYIVDEKGDKTELIKADILKIIPFEKPTFGFTKTEDDGKIFKKSVEIAKKYIKAGDIFQANLSRNWNVKIDKNIADIDIYNLLRKSNPAPFAAFAKFDDFSIISSSPERLFCVDNGIIQTRPIAGTRPRNIENGKDNELKKELQDNLKEQAEHLMLLDLERNDMGRICEYGSVEVDEVMVIESYEFVHHIVSNIKGALKSNTTIGEMMSAIFPGGTITGCPKIRSMQIIDELENSTREAYTGSLGYISNCGKMDFNILIRTMIKKERDISFRAGAGIVFDSVADNELIETKHKAKGLLNIFKN